jgi:hypothetical protein
VAISDNYQRYREDEIKELATFFAPILSHGLQFENYLIDENVRNRLAIEKEYITSLTAAFIRSPIFQNEFNTSQYEEHGRKYAKYDEECAYLIAERVRSANSHLWLSKYFVKETPIEGSMIEGSHKPPPLTLLEDNNSTTPHGSPTEKGSFLSRIWSSRTNLGSPKDREKEKESPKKGSRIQSTGSIIERGEARNNSPLPVPVPRHSSAGEKSETEKDKKKKKDKRGRTSPP